MKTHIVTTYSATELKEQFPDAFERALEHYRNNMEPGWTGEIFDSLKAVLRASDVTLRDYNLGAYNRGNHIRVSFPHDDCEDLRGKRAIAWLENHLFGPLRFQGNARIDDWSKHIDAAGKFDSRKIDESAKYYRACNSNLDRKLSRRHGLSGSIPSCPLTGVCFDEDYLDALRASMRNGDTLKEAFQGLADVYAELVESEIESQSTEEAFIETAEANDWQFTEDSDLH